MSKPLDSKAYLVLVFRRIYTVDASRGNGAGYYVKLRRYELVYEFESVGALATLRAANRWRDCGRSYHVEVMPLK